MKKTYELTAMIGLRTLATKEVVVESSELRCVALSFMRELTDSLSAFVIVRLNGVYDWTIHNEYNPQTHR